MGLASDEPTAVYRLYGSCGDLLYVGITSTPSVRMGAHRREKGWWPEVDPTRTAYDWLESRPAAARAEIQAIRDEAPRYNLADNPAEREAMASRAREVALSAMAVRRVEVPEWEATAAAIEAVEDPAERARLAGQQLAEVPTWQKRVRRVRLAAVNEMYSEGMTKAEIARVLGVHRNRVQQLLT